MTGGLARTTTLPWNDPTGTDPLGLFPPAPPAPAPAPEAVKPDSSVSGALKMIAGLSVLGGIAGALEGESWGKPGAGFVIGAVGVALIGAGLVAFNR